MEEQRSVVATIIAMLQALSFLVCLGAMIILPLLELKYAKDLRHELQENGQRD